MVLSFCRITVGAVIAFTIALDADPAFAAARELATSQGTITISNARMGLRAPLCSELVVEARDAIDNHLIGETQPTTDEGGSCRYVLSVPAQTAVWLRLQPALVADARVFNGTNVNTPASGRARPTGGSVALRFSVIAPMTYFFAPNEQKTVPLTY